MPAADAALADFLAAPRASEHPVDQRLPLGLALPVVLGVSGGLWVLIYQGVMALVG